MWKPTPEQLHNVDSLIDQAERREREFRERIQRRKMVFDVTPFEPPVIATTKLKPKPAPIPPHQCKVDHYTTTDQDGRTWVVEHRH